MIKDERNVIENIEEEKGTSIGNISDIEKKVENLNIDDESFSSDDNNQSNNIEEANTIVKPLTNYLGKNILDLKTYSFEEITEIDKDINEDTLVDFNESFDANLPELHEKQLIKGTVVSMNDKRRNSKAVLKINVEIP